MIITDDVLKTMAATLATQLLSLDSGDLSTRLSGTLDQDALHTLYQNGLAKLLRNLAATPNIQDLEQLHHIVSAWLNQPQIADALLGLALSSPAADLEDGRAIYNIVIQN